MKIFEVPRQTTRVQVRLLGGYVVEGSLYYAAQGPGGAPGRLSDRLNDSTERFVPLSMEKGGRLVSKARVLTILIADPAAEVPPACEEHTSVEVRTRLLDAVEVRGQLAYTMPPGQERVLDYLNSAPEFIPIRGADGVVLVNREAIVAVENLQADPEAW